MPWSMQFQGNFFIHGPTVYPDGSPTPLSYSGGCIRVALDNVEEIFNIVNVGAFIQPSSNLLYQKFSNNGNRLAAAR